MAFQALARDIGFALEHIAGFNEVIESGAFPDLDWDVVDAILGEAGKMASDLIAPLNTDADEIGVKFDNGVVTTSPSFKEAYAQVVESGWVSIPFDPDYGGMGLPCTVSIPVQEMFDSASLAFG
jgi:alkylation response protein AidB-like acyl-CoA dehydrogenase